MSYASSELLSTAQIDGEPAENLLWRSYNGLQFFLLCFKSTHIPTNDISLINAKQHPNIKAQCHYENQDELYSSNNWKLDCIHMPASQCFEWIQNKTHQQSSGAT